LINLNSSFNYFPGYQEGYKNNGSNNYKKGDGYHLKGEDKSLSKQYIENITNKLVNSNGSFSKFYYITHIKQLSSILKKGIKPRNIVSSRQYESVDISNSNVQQYRNYNIELSMGTNTSLKNCVPLYFTPLHPMLYVRQDKINEIVVLSISVDILKDKIEFAFSDKNAADSKVNFYNNLDLIENIDWNNITGDYWNDKFYGPEFESWKEKRMAEFIIYPDVAPIFIEDFLCANIEVSKEIELTIDQVVNEYPKFFNKNFKKDITITKDLILEKKNP
tara:strand:+ start:871 stop:1698 length:828 start_codon:yes stop_codon:yes gene_type:complete